jgi:hypothetical protein
VFGVPIEGEEQALLGSRPNDLNHHKPTPQLQDHPTWSFKALPPPKGCLISATGKNWG